MVAKALRSLYSAFARNIPSSLNISVRSINGSDKSIKIAVINTGHTNKVVQCSFILLSCMFIGFLNQFSAPKMRSSNAHSSPDPQ